MAVQERDKDLPLDLGPTTNRKLPAPAIQETLKVKSQYSNINGIYEPNGKDSDKKPTWKKKGGGMFLYHLPPNYKPMWAFGENVGDTSTYCSEDSEGTKTPLEVGAWGAGGEPSISVLKTVDTSRAPDSVRIESRYGNIDGGYVRKDDDYEGYPAYENENDGIFIFHDAAAGTWFLSSALGDRANFNKCESDEVDVTKLDPDMWNDPEAITAIQEITWKNVPDDDGYIDMKFPADFTSLGAEWIEDHPDYNDASKIEWIRAPDINRHEPDDLFGPISPSEMKQGMVGNCWLIAAVCCVAEFPGSIQALIEPKEISEDGRYEVKLFDIRTDSWEIVTVDDYIPCQKRWFWEFMAKPLFSRNNGTYLWPMILEKAVAKFCSTYGSLDGGKESFAWQALTGCSNQTSYSRDPDEDTWQKYALNVEKQKEAMSTDRRACPMYGHGEKFSSDQVWKILVDSDKRNFLMAASIDPSGNSREHKRQNGLVEGHAYSLISAVESGGYRFLKLRNPWGEHEWNGDWSDDSPLWDQYPSLASELAVEGSADGCFWMEYCDFLDNYTGISISEMSMTQKRSLGLASGGVRSRAIGPQSLTSPRKKKKPQGSLQCGNDGCALM